MRRPIPRGLIRYLIVGILSFGLDFGLIFVFHDVAGSPIWFAAAVSFLLSFIFNYLLQRAFAFASVVPHARSLFKYVCLVLANTLLTVFIVDWFATTVFGWGSGKVIATGLTTFWNYFLLRYWLFPVVANDKSSLKE